MDALYTAVATAGGRDGRAFSSDGQLDLTLAEQLFAAAARFTSALGLVGHSPGASLSLVKRGVGSGFVGGAVAEHGEQYAERWRARRRRPACGSFRGTAAGLGRKAA
ncbi:MULTISPECIES: hypothetical protein [unclassified Streptomyces]|uniref:hypothetical protein n=1 Tax=unclassified Streptomyces TaxID=2593676 RepID=UPI003D94E7AC